MSQCGFYGSQYQGCGQYPFPGYRTDPKVHDVTYENGQHVREPRFLWTLQIRPVVWSSAQSDLSELALGWATYNGDHMSMYAVNASVPKTLVRHLVRYYADTAGDEALEAVLLDVLDTPVSPELLPPEDGKISQKTEDLVGPYELHDFYLYHMLRLGYAPAKIYRLAKIAFAGTYEDETILKWLKTFTADFLHSSSNVPACRMDQKSEALLSLRAEICVCLRMRLHGSGWKNWRH